MSHTLDNVAAEEEVTSSMLLIRDEEERAAEHERLRVEDPDLLHAIEQSDVLEIPQFPSSQADENDRVNFALQASIAEQEVTVFQTAHQDGVSPTLGDRDAARAAFALQMTAAVQEIIVDPWLDGEMEVEELQEELQEGVPLATPAEAAAAAEHAAQGAPPIVVGEVFVAQQPVLGSAPPRLSKLQQQLARLGCTQEMKDNADKRWQALAQQGLFIMLHERSTHYEVSLYVGQREIMIMEREAPSMHWVQHFNVHASNKKDATLLAKIHIHLDVESLRVAGGYQKLHILRAPDGILDPRDRHGMVEWGLADGSD